MLEQITKLGWRAVEIALLLVILCVLINIIAGPGSGAFVAGVAANALAFIQAVPPGALLGIALLVLLYGLYRSRRQP